MDLQLADDNLHAWAIGRLPEDHWNVVFTTSPESTMSGTLAGVVWRSGLVSSWLAQPASKFVDHVLSGASGLGLEEAAGQLVKMAAQHVKTWMEAVREADEKNAVDIGIAPLPTTWTLLNGGDPKTRYRPGSVDTGLFHGAMNSLLVLDFVFWSSGSQDSERTLPAVHQLYRTPGDPDIGLLPDLCRRLYRWEDHIITKADITSKAISRPIIMSDMNVADALLMLYRDSPTWKWGKVRRNMIALAIGIRLVYGLVRFIHVFLPTLVHGDSQDVFGKAEADTIADARRAVAVVMGAGPLVVLLPEMMVAKRREYPRYEWRMVCSCNPIHPPPN
jgi:hypothetical protein